MGTKEVVINVCYGGFGLSPMAEKEYLKLKGKECYFYIERIYDKNDEKYLSADPNDDKKYKQIPMNAAKDAFITYTFTRDLGQFFEGDFPKEDYFYDGNIERDDPDLVAVVKKLGSKKASGEHAKLKIVEIPDNVDWEIDEYDGAEHIDEKHRSWH